MFILISSISGLLVFNYKKTNKKKKKEIVEEDISLFVKEEKEEVKEIYKVDIKGEINNPGIYSLEKDKRVIDVIDQAGGLTENADTSVINLSKKISDEMVIIIYSREEVSNFIETKQTEQVREEKCIQKDENALINNACISQTEIITGKVSINTATLEQLQTLPGIGEAKAKDIITYREQNGPFENIEDIMKVSGIGESLFAQIKENITL